MVRPALSSLHSSSDAHILDVLPAYNGEVDHVPLFGPWVHPGSFVLVRLPVESVGDSEVAFSAKAQ